MKKYIKPAIKVSLVELENHILAGSTSVGIDDDPATGPACSKQQDFLDEEESSSSSIWDN